MKICFIFVKGPTLLDTGNITYETSFHKKIKIMKNYR